MTRIRRPHAKQQRLALVSIVFGISGILLLTIYLFQLDAFPNRKGRPGGIMKKKAPAITPEKLLAQEFIRKRDMSEGGIEGTTSGNGHGQDIKTADDGQDDKEEENGAEQEEEKEEEEQNEAVFEADGNSEKEKVSGSSFVRPKRFAFDLANLKDGKSGTFVLETRPNWSPIGVNHFHKLLEAHFYTDCRFFRVVKNFVAQFGIAADPKVQQTWRTDIIKDDPVVQSNRRGTVTFATSGKDSRTTQVFINFKDNSYLDKQGFSPIAEIVAGMEYVDLINDEYGEKPSQGRISKQGNEYLKEQFPNLSFISAVREVSNEVAVE